MTELHERDKVQHSVSQWCVPVRPLQNKVLEGFHPLWQGLMDKLLREEKKNKKTNIFVRGFITGNCH